MLGPIGVVVLALAAAYNMRYGPARFSTADFRSFYQAGLDVRAGVDPYRAALGFVHAYRPNLSASYFASQAYVYAPFFALLMVPLTLLPGYAALTLWDVLNVAFLALAIHALLRAAGVRAGAGLTLILSAAAAVTLPLHREWDLGQTDVLLMALLGTSLWSRAAGRRALAGFLLGAAAAIKPELLLLAVVLVWRREFRYGLASIAATLVLLLAPFALLARSAWSSFWTVWRFWADQYLPFLHNEAPRGVLARLFTVNPVSPPLTAAPAAETAVWILVVAVVVALLIGVTSPRPLHRDSLSLLEIGLSLEAIMLVSPLTERPYFLLLIVPLVSILCWLRQADWKGSFVRRAALATAAIWILLIGPAEVWEYAVDPGVSGTSRLADLYVVLAPAYLWVTVAAFVLQLVVVARARGLRVLPAVQETVRQTPVLLRDWVRDAGMALRTGRRGRPALS